MHEQERVRLAIAAAGVSVAATLSLLILLGGRFRPARADPGTRYVSATDPTCGGKSPCHATVQAAVDAASSDDEILVATGHYTGVQARGGVTQVVYINQPLAILGGYSADFSTRNPQAHPTILDAEAQGRVFYLTGSAGGTTLDGLRITGGNAISVGGGSPLIPDAGGGIYVDKGGGITLISNQIYSNTASYGGGTWFYMSHNARLVSNDVCSNTATGGGGGIGSQYGYGHTLTGNRVFNNVAREFSGGGLHLFDADGSTLTRNEVVSNTADDWGGGVYFSSSTGVTLKNNVVAGNRGEASLYMHQSGDSRLLHTTVARNSGTRGVYLSQGVYWLTNTILVSHTVGIWVQPETTATLAATLWGTGTWANATDWRINNGTLITGTLNWWEEPAFADPTGGDYHIGAGSGALDRGVDAGVSTDIDNEPRFYGPPDLGFDEYWPPGALKRAYLPLVLRNR